MSDLTHSENSSISDVRAQSNFDKPIPTDLSTDEVKYSHLLKIAAGLGDHDAMLELGFRYGAGDGVPRDEIASTDWYLLAARKGNIPAMICLAEAYRTGVGVRKDTRESCRWLARAIKRREQAESKPLRC
jgi:TPR repeat protein